MQTMKWTLLVLAAAATLSGCARKPPPELLGKWERVQTIPFGGGTITDRLSLRDEWKYTVSRKGISNPAGAGRMTQDGMEVIHSGTFDVQDGVLVLKVRENYLAGVDVAALEMLTLKTPYTVSGNTLMLQNTEALFPPSPIPGGLVPAPGPAAGSGPVTLTKVP